jgi:hypothetical protein
MNTIPFNNPNVSQFYTGGATYGAGNRSNLGSLGSISSASTSASAPAGNMQSTASSIASLVASGNAAAKGILQAEAAQNAINAQKNLTSALTPGVITIGLAVLAYALVFRKK